MKAALIKRGGKPPALKGRPLTALPNWPLTLLAGVEGSGKSFSAIEAATSPLVGHTYAIELGEGSLDAYGAMPGAQQRVTYLQHDGTYADITGQLWAAVEAPRVDGKPNLIVIDSMTSMWDLLINEQQEIADRRARARGKKVADGEADIHSDLWNAAKKRWLAITDLLKEHDGPSIITARLNEVLIFEGNQPRRDGAKEWKVEAHKSTTFEVDVVLQARKPRTWICTKVRSLKLTLDVDVEAAVPNFTMDGFWRSMGLDETTETSARQVVALNADHGADEQEAEEAELQAALAAERPGGQRPSSQRPVARTGATDWAAEVAKAGTADRIYELHAAAKAAGQLTDALEAAMKARRDQFVAAAAQPEQPAGGAGDVLAKARERKAPHPRERAAASPTEAPATVGDVVAGRAQVVALDDDERELWLAELDLIAQIMAVQGGVPQLTGRIIGERKPAELPSAKLIELVGTRLRPLAIRKLRGTRRTAAADVYEQFGPGETGTREQLLGKSAGEPDAA